ncbi:MAG: tRNA (adenosine(37)-N6)-dimethylallyltransferase MiaA [Candidatus Babeliales bacterium]
MGKKILVIYGPTGVGKSDFALKLARLMNGEIINADVGQFYTPLSIGTAKPAWQSSDVPHYLFDIIDKPRNITVTEYRSLVHGLILKIWDRNALPIIVGGSTFYINSLFFPPQSEALENKNMSSFDQYSDKQLWEMLKKIDPQRASEIHPHDTYRIKRALTIWEQTNIKPSEYKPQYEPLAPYFLLFLNRERFELYNRINERVKQMIQVGWIEEVAALEGTEWESFLQHKKIIGYDDILYYLAQKNNHASINTLIATIAQKTRNYAKRQITFWQMLKRKLTPLAKQEYNVKIKSLCLTNNEQEEKYILMMQEIKQWFFKDA